MPIEIKELVIKTTIGNNNQPGATSLPESDVKMIISACVDQVMDLLREKDER